VSALLLDDASKPAMPLTTGAISDCIENLDVTVNATAGVRKKIQRRRNWSVDDFDAMETRRGKSIRQRRRLKIKGGV